MLERSTQWLTDNVTHNDSFSYGTIIILLVLVTVLSWMWMVPNEDSQVPIGPIEQQLGLDEI